MKRTQKYKSKGRTCICKKVVKYMCMELDIKYKDMKCKAIEKHLRDCPKCLHYLKDLKMMIALYRKYQAPKLPQFVVQDVLEKIKLGKC